jgi:hypothetical protein
LIEADFQNSLDRQSGISPLVCSLLDPPPHLKVETTSRPVLLSVHPKGMAKVKVPDLTFPLDQSLDPVNMLRVEQADQCGEGLATCPEPGMMGVSRFSTNTYHELMTEPGGGHVQADTDTPYPRVEGRGMSTSWTPWQDGAPVENDYRYSVGHRGRMREGKV